MNIENKNTCCFSGHRPNNLPWKYNESGLHFNLFKIKLRRTIKKAIKLGYTHFISGMAIGTDIICAEIVLELKKKYKNITLECAIPCLNQTEKWFHKSIKRYNEILKKADKINIISNKNYFNGCMQKRNRYMIDNSSLLISVYCGIKGGTHDTIMYAKSKNIKVVILKP